MSWLFGKKKHQKDWTPESTEEEQSSDTDQKFVWVENAISSTNLGNEQRPQGNLYPYIGNNTPYPTLPPNDCTMQSSHDSVNYLSDVPFKLCKRLESTMNSDLEIDSLKISEILSYIERIENQNYDYDFSVEQSVIAEMNSTDE